MKTQQDILHGRSLEEVAEAARAYEESHAPFDKRPMKKVHEPGHPDADKEGYVTYPDINVVEEMANMITTMRSYEANVQAIQDTKAMFNKALQIAR